MCTACSNLSSRGICWSIENPTNSLMWQYPQLNALVADKQEVRFDACMHGSRRRKHTSIWTNRTWFAALAAKCDGAHDHLPWGKTKDGARTVWSTALESAYTPQLASAWAQCAADAVFPPGPRPQTKYQRKRACFEPNFARRLVLTDASITTWEPLATPCAAPSHLHLPKGSKLLRYRRNPPEAVLEIPREPIDWCRLATKLTPPWDLPPSLPPELTAAIHAEAALPIPALAKLRTHHCTLMCQLQQASATPEHNARTGLAREVQSA